MRNSPFKFFFAFSIGVIVFFFLARVFVAALVMAAVLSLVFFVFRKIKNFFKYMTWEDRYDRYQRSYQYQRNLPYWEREEDTLFDLRETRRRERIIIVE